MASHIDSAATSIISYCVHMATQSGMEKGREWIDAADAAGLAGRPDVEAMRKLLEIHVDFVGPNSKTLTREERLLERLDALDKVSKEIRTLVTVSSTARADSGH
jgi:hypothetical protein